MNLVLLTQYYPPEIGAPQTRLSELAAHFVQRGHSVTVLTAMPNYPTGKISPGYGGVWQREQRDGVNVIRTFIYPTQKADFLRRLTNYFSFVLSSGLLGSVLLGRADFLLVESPPLFLGASAWWLSRLRGARLIFNVSDLWPASAVNLGVVSPDGAAYRAACWLEAACYRAAWLVTGQSKEIVADISARFPNCPTYHLSNAVDTEAFRPDRGSELMRAKLGGTDRCLAVYAGLHGLAQGLDQLLDAAAAVGPELEVALIGDGPEKPRLVADARRRALTNVRFHDPVPRSDMPATIATADMVLVPLRTHIPGAVPSKLYEAMASGRPVVLVAEGEAGAIVRKWNAGVVVSPGDIAGLTRALQLLSGDAALRTELGANGRRAIEAEFDRSAIGERFVRYLEERL